MRAFRFLGCTVRVSYSQQCEQVSDLLACCFGTLETLGLQPGTERETETGEPSPEIHYAVEAAVADAGSLAAGSGAAGSGAMGYRLRVYADHELVEELSVEDEGALLFRVEKDLTTRIQRLRADLLFLHAAVVGWRGRAVLLVGDPGAGKSTLTFALLEKGFDYLSDELAPIALAARQVHPYPRALWLKQPPPSPHQLPGAVVHSSRGIHVTCQSLGATAADEPYAMGPVFLLEPGVASRRQPSIQRISAAEATVRLFANYLNPRGHPGDGLDAVLEVASAVPCYRLEPARLDSTRALVLDALAKSPRG